MMNSLFSSFEPSNFNAMAILSIPILMSALALSIDGKSKALWNQIEKFIFSEVSVLIKSNMIIWAMLCFFCVNSLTNLFSMTPFSFTMNSMLSVVFPSCLTLFAMVLMIQLIEKPKTFIAHLVPMGSPLLMSPFLVVVEIISYMIRPITLSVRMMANLMTGHLLIHLLGKMFISIKMTFLFTLISGIALNMLELGVALMQAYIMMILMTIYLSE